MKRLIAALCLGLVTLAACPLWAADAWVFLDDHRQPLYVHALRVHYYRDVAGGEELVVVLPDQQKYTKYNFRELRSARFLGVADYRYLMPVYGLKLDLAQNAATMQVMLMPLQKLTGYVGGKPWRLELGPYDEDEPDKTAVLKEIRFVHDEP